MSRYLALLDELDQHEITEHVGTQVPKVPEAPSVTFGTPVPEYVGTTAEDRRAWSDELCARLHAGIAQQSPPGLGRWPEAWEIVEEPSKRLLDLLADWERTGNDADRRAAIVAAEDVALAWERAALAWQATRTPRKVA